MVTRQGMQRWPTLDDIVVITLVVEEHRVLDPSPFVWSEPDDVPVVIAHFTGWRRGLWIEKERPWAAFEVRVLPHCTQREKTEQGGWNGRRDGAVVLFTMG
jgi:hypothetical protein